jgi:hypothetical protein
MSGQLDNTKHGGSIESQHEFLLIAEDETIRYFAIPEKSATEPESIASALSNLESVPTFQLDEFNVMPPSVTDLAMNKTPYGAKVCNRVRHRSMVEPTFGWPVYDCNTPAPSIQVPRKEEEYFSAWFVVSSVVPKKPPICHCVTDLEITRMLGIADESWDGLSCLESHHRQALLRATPGLQGLVVMFTSLYFAELYQNPLDNRQSVNNSTPMNTATFVNVPRNDSSVIPLPTDQEWIEATIEDHDLCILVQANDLTSVPTHLFLDKIYAELIRKNQLEEEKGIIFYFERSKASRVRQPKVRVVPLKLRRIVIAACHSSPFGGHSGITRTLYRVQTRYWWPGMFRDIHDGIRGCAHCNLANAASHESQLLLNTLACDEPFDVIHLDIWSPGDISDKDGNIKVLTFLEAMAGFAMAAFLQGEINAHKVANAVVSTLFITVGLPRLIVVDADSISFAGVFVQLFQLLQVPVYTVSRENHKAILNERFHRYFNKVQRINSADMNELLKWKQGVCFSLYGWNAAPIDGTDIARSVVAVGRDFPLFPIDLSASNPVPRWSKSMSQQAIDHYEAASPLLYKQRELLQVLNDERRERHRELRNKGKQEREFFPGDIVIVRKQVKSEKAKGVSAKLLFKTKGPYRVIDKASPNSYRIQKLPFLKGLGRKGRIVKQKASRMTCLPSTLILHKKIDGADTRFARMDGELSNAPLQPWLGVLKHGAYNKAAANANWAFEPLESIWSEPMDDEANKSEDESTADDNEAIFDNMDFPIDQQDSDSDKETESNGGEAEVDTPKLKPININDLTSKALQQLYRKVQDSQDKMFFVAWQPENASTPELRVAQVCWEDCDPISTR